MIRTASNNAFTEAKKYLVGGVNSPVRAFKALGGDPIFIKNAKGAYLYDLDGNSYIDYINSWGPMILGHAKEEIHEAILKAAENSISFGAPHEGETQMAERIVSMVPNIDKVRLVNSGTEACMSAIRLARGYTGKDKFIKLEGNYHGHADPFLIKAGSGASTLGTPNSPGVTAGTAKDTLLAPHNNLEAIQQLIDENPNEIAAIILEPVAGNMGCIPPKEGYLKGLRAICDKYSILLIFDEVMTGFRLAQGGAQELYNVSADIVCFGKVIGGGMPVGAYAASKEIMSYLAPEGPVYQAGTLSGNPLAMAAGNAMLGILQKEGSIYSEIKKTTDTLHVEIDRVLSAKNTPFTINQVGSMISVHFCENQVVDYESAQKGNNDTFKEFFHHALNQGVYLPPSAFETWFISTEVGDAEIEKTVKAFETFNF